MATQTFKSRIDQLINELGGNPKPGPIDIRNRLIKFAALADVLESGQSAVEAEKKVAVLEATIAELETQNKATKAQLEYAETQAKEIQTALEAARVELRRAQKQEAEHEPLSAVEGVILDMLDKSGVVHAGDIALPFSGFQRIGVITMIESLRCDGFLDSNIVGRLDNFSECFLTKKGKAWLCKNRQSSQDTKQPDDPLSTLERRILEYIDGRGDVDVLTTSQALNVQADTLLRRFTSLKAGGYLTAEKEDDTGDDEYLFNYSLTKNGKAWLKNRPAPSKMEHQANLPEQGIPNPRTNLPETDAPPRTTKAWEIASLNGIEIEILKLLAASEREFEHLGSIGNTKKAVVIYYAEVLEKRGFVARTAFAWYITIEGKEYLVKRNEL